MHFYGTAVGATSPTSKKRPMHSPPVGGFAGLRTTRVRFRRPRGQRCDAYSCFQVRETCHCLAASDNQCRCHLPVKFLRLQVASRPKLVKAVTEVASFRSMMAIALVVRSGQPVARPPLIHSLKRFTVLPKGPPVAARLRKDPSNHIAVDIGQAILASLISERQFRVIDATKMQDRRLHIVDVHRVGSDVPTEIIS